MLLPVYKILSMKHEFTQLQLTRLVYGETTKAENDMLLELVLSVPQMAESLDELSKAKKALDTIRQGPSDLVMNRIMAYSAATATVSASWEPSDGYRIWIQKEKGLSLLEKGLFWFSGPSPILCDPENFFVKTDNFIALTRK